MRVKIQIGEIHHDGFTRDPDNFPSDCNETDYLKNALAENINNFCARENKDLDDYADVLYSKVLKWIKVQVVDNSSYDGVL